MLRVYLDTCCVNRPFDDQADERVRHETDAILEIIRRCVAGELVWIGSDVLDFEVQQAKELHVIAGAELMLEYLKGSVPTTAAIVSRAEEVTRLGIRIMDALHLASAESADVAVLLTTDDKLLKAAQRNASYLRVKVMNPLDLLREGSET